MIEQLIGAAGLYAAGMTILHSFWQATLLAFALWLFSRRPRSSAVARYWTGMALLAGQLVLSVLTFAHYLEAGSGLVTMAAAAPVLAQMPAAMADTAPVWSVDFWLTVLVASWAASMVAGTIRLGWSYGQLRRLATTAEPVTASGAYAGFYAEVRQLALRLGYHGPLRLGISERISGPMLVGHLKPVLLFPLALVNDLTTDEAETVILHELAHLRRCDHLLHPLQCAVEILYYYHPAVHWISERIREERENCCDDLVLLHGPGRLPYARALLYFSEHPPATAALSLTDGGGLLARVRRFIDHQEIKYTMNSRLLLLPLLALLVLVATAAYIPSTAETTPVAGNAGLTAHLPAPALAAPDTLPPGDHQVTKISNGKTTRLRVADGEIKELELEGRTVPPEEFADYEETAEELLGLKEAPRRGILHRDSFFRLAPMHGAYMDSVHVSKALAKVRDLDYGDFEFEFGELAEQMDSLSGEIARMYHFDSENMEGGFRWEGFDFDSIRMPHLPDLPMFRPYLRELDELDLDELEAREREIKDALRELEKRREKLSGEEGEIRGEALHVFPDVAPEGFMDRSIAHRKAAARQAREQFLAEGRRIREQSANRGTDCPEAMAVALADGPDPRVVVEIEREVRRVVRPLCAG